MALGITTKPVTVSGIFSAKEAQKRSASNDRSRRRGSLPFSIGPVTKVPISPLENSWLVRRLASLLRRTSTEGGDEGVTTIHSHKSQEECCMQCRQAFDETVQRWTSDEECTIDPTTVYRQQLRVLLQEEPTTIEFTETDFKNLTRSLSEGDLGREENDDTREAIDSLIERYGLMSGDDFSDTLCIPEGTVLGDDECYITSAFIESLERSDDTQADSVNSSDSTTSSNTRPKKLSENNRPSSLCNDYQPDSDGGNQEPVSRTRTFPQCKRRVSALLFDTLARRLSKHCRTDPKWKRDSVKNVLERAWYAENDGLPDHLSSALSPPNEISEIEAVPVDSSTTAKYNLNDNDLILTLSVKEVSYTLVYLIFRHCSCCPAYKARYYRNFPQM
ncbi:hypothetical protein COOONC_06167 [Cooperia oncophora]